MANIDVVNFVSINRVCESFEEMAEMLANKGYEITPGYAKSKFKALHKYFSKASQSYPWRKKLRYYPNWDKDHRGRKSMSDRKIDQLFEDYTEPTYSDEEMSNDLIVAKSNAIV